MIKEIREKVLKEKRKKKELYMKMLRERSDPRREG